MNMVVLEAQRILQIDFHFVEMVSVQLPFSGENFRKCGEYYVSKSSTEGQVPENKLKKQGVMPSFLCKMDNKINQEKHSEPQTNKNNKDGDEDPLSLSLACISFLQLSLVAMNKLLSLFLWSSKLLDF